MRTIFLPLLIALPSCFLLVGAARADDALYRCQKTDGSITVQGVPCPKGDIQRKIPFDRPPEPVASQAPAPTSAPASVPLVLGHPVTPASQMQAGPNDPYPLWQCMRPDGSTYDSRDGVPARQWVANTESAPNSAENDQAAELAKQFKKSGSGAIVRPYTVTPPAADMSATEPPPAGAAPGQWVVDECVKLTPKQACERFATRRDSLRKQIYAAKPSERSNYAPEEQDLTTMLFAACGL